MPPSGWQVLESLTDADLDLLAAGVPVITKRFKDQIAAPRLAIDHFPSSQDGPSAFFRGILVYLELENEIGHPVSFLFCPIRNCYQLISLTALCTPAPIAALKFVTIS